MTTDINGSPWRADYAAYINSSDWQQKRQHVLARDEHTCQDCGATEHLHVHHLTYENLGDEPHWELITLCEDCHFTRHDNSFVRGVFGGAWDEEGSATAWRRKHWTDVRHNLIRYDMQKMRGGIDYTEREESFYAEELEHCAGHYGSGFGGDLRVMNDDFDRQMERD